MFIQVFDRVADGGEEEDERDVEGLIKVPPPLALARVQPSDGIRTHHVVVQLEVIGEKMVRALVLVDPGVRGDGPQAVDDIIHRTRECVEQVVTIQIAAFMMAHVINIKHISNQPKGHR